VTAKAGNQRGDGMQAVRFDEYGGVDVLEVREAEDPVASAGEVLVAVKAAGINPGEISIREGLLQERFPATFPSGEGTDFGRSPRRPARRSSSQPQRAGSARSPCSLRRRR
jgi:hypothetical protein